MKRNEEPKAHAATQSLTLALPPLHSNHYSPQKKRRRCVRRLRGKQLLLSFLSKALTGLDQGMIAAASFEKPLSLFEASSAVVT